LTRDREFLQGVQEFSGRWGSYAKGNFFGFFFTEGMPLEPVIADIRKLAEGNGMKVEWGVARVCSDANEGESAESWVLGSLSYQGRRSEESDVVVRLQLPGAAYELCEALWGPPIADFADRT